MSGRIEEDISLSQEIISYFLFNALVPSENKKVEMKIKMTIIIHTISDTPRHKHINE